MVLSRKIPLKQSLLGFIPGVYASSIKNSNNFTSQNELKVSGEANRCTPPPIVKVDRGVKTSARLHKLLDLLNHNLLVVPLFNFRSTKLCHGYLSDCCLTLQSLSFYVDHGKPQHVVYTASIAYSAEERILIT